MKNKKFLLGIVLGIIVAIILAVVVFLLVRNTKGKTIKIVEKSLECSNYTMEYNKDKENIKVQYKDNYYMIKSDIEESQTYFVYEDVNNDEFIIGDDNYALIGKLSEHKNDENLEYLESFSSVALKYLNSEDYEYSYEGKTKIDNEKCIIINLKQKDPEKVSSDPYQIKYTINKKTGFVNKVEKFDKEGNSTSTIDVKITLNNVTDEDVKRPDLNTFKQTLNF